MTLFSIIPRHLSIVRFGAVSCKNYGYDLENPLTGKPMGHVVKCRGFNIDSAQGQEQMNTGLLLQFIKGLQKGEHMEVPVKQFQIKICGETKTLHSKDVVKLYSNMANDKRMYLPDHHPTKTFPYGATNFE